MTDTFPIRWSVTSPESTQEKSSAILAIAVKHAAVVPLLCFWTYLKLSEELGRGGKLFSAFIPCSFTKS